MLTIQGGAIEALSSRLRTELARRTQILAGDRVGPLVAEIDGYVDQVRSALSRNEFLNIDLAQRIASVLKILLSAYSEIASDHVKALIVGAARFFLETNDLWADLDSPLGFDDDADVLNAVLRDIRREDLLIDK